VNGPEIDGRIREYVRGMMAAQSMAADELSDDTPLLERNIIDSFGVLSFVEHLEREFGIAVRDRDMIPEHFATVRAIAGFVRSRQG
jgi:acyl carrier protein